MQLFRLTAELQNSVTSAIEQKLLSLIFLFFFRLYFLILNAER